MAHSAHPPAFSKSTARNVNASAFRIPQLGCSSTDCIPLSQPLTEQRRRCDLGWRASAPPPPRHAGTAPSIPSAAGRVRGGRGSSSRARRGFRQIQRGGGSGGDEGVWSARRQEVGRGSWSRSRGCDHPCLPLPPAWTCSERALVTRAT
jgi:hypothetical protein